ncbi:hypothetical protein E3O05_25200 [Escherichia coli]|nr:hypothetical protein E3O05_25200 [Escherichia coli]
MTGTSILASLTYKNETMFYLELKRCFATFKMDSILKNETLFCCLIYLSTSLFLTRGHREMA